MSTLAEVTKNGTWKLAGIAAGVLTAIIAINSFTIITAESEGSVTSFGEVHKGKNLTGFNLVAPWWSIDEYNTLLTTLTLDDRGIPSQDKFKTQMDISYTGRFIKGQASATRSSTGDAEQFLATHVDKKVRSCTIGAGTRVENSQAFFNETVQLGMSRYVLDCVNTYLTSSQVGGSYEITQVQFTDISLDPTVKKFMVTTKERQEGEQQQASSLRIADLKAQEVTKVAQAREAASVFDKVAAKNVSDAKLYDMRITAEGNALIKDSISPAYIKYIEASRWNGQRSKIVANGGNTDLLVDVREE